MTTFSSVVKILARSLQIPFESQFKRISGCSIGIKSAICVNHKILQRNLVHFKKISFRNYHTSKPLYQRKRLPLIGLLRILKTTNPRTRVIILTGLTGFVFIFYRYHLEESPITKRKRFMIFDNQAVAKMSAKINEDMLNKYEPDMISPGHPKHKKVRDVVDRLLLANEDVALITRIPWKLSVVNKPAVNAFVLVDGHIVVFTGMVDFCKNEHQLAAVLGHELSHVILEHIPEKISYSQLLNILLIIPILTIVTVFPLAKVILVESLMSNIAQLAISLPFSRKLETEADEVGMILAARACFDVREASKLWERMDKTSKGQPPGFLSTHPSHRARKQQLEKLADPAMRLRSRQGCPPL